MILISSSSTIGSRHIEAAGLCHRVRFTYDAERRGSRSQALAAENLFPSLVTSVQSSTTRFPILFGLFWGVCHFWKSGRNSFELFFERNKRS